MHLILWLAACLSGQPSSSADPAPAPVAEAARAQGLHPSGLDVILLGTGTPVPDPNRQGPAIAMVYQGMSMVFDAGPGVVRQAAAAAVTHRQPALEPGKVRYVFLTHLHSDHTTGLPDLMLGGWVLGRATPLRVFGPPGTKALVDGILAGWVEDIDVRQGVEELPPRGIKVEVTEIEADGEVLDTHGVKVAAFTVPHGTWPHAFGYRVDAGGRSVVLSGDTDRSEAVSQACSGCDLLLHEVYSEAGFEGTTSKSFQRYHSTFHTSGPEVGEIATLAQAKEVVLYHQLFFGHDEASIVREVQSTYGGPVTSGNDLDRF